MSELELQKWGNEVGSNFDNIRSQSPETILKEKESL